MTRSRSSTAKTPSFRAAALALWAAAAGGPLGFHGLPCTGTAQAADIGSAAPSGVLPVRPENEPLAKAAAEAFDKFSAGVAEWKDKTLDQLKSINPTGLGQVHVQGERLGRLAERLVALGEPCGEELRLRRKVLKEAIQSPINTVALVRGSDFQKQLPALVARGKQRAAKLGAVEALAKQGKWDEAERELQLILDELEGPAAFYDGKARGEILEPFAAASKAVLDGVRTADRERFKKAHAAGQAAYDAAHAAFAKQLKEAPAALQTHRKVALGSAPLEGPEAAAELLLRFRATTGLGMQARAWEWCNLEDFQVDRVALIEQQSDERFAELVQTLAAMIDADASAASPDDARKLYGRYLVALAPLVAETTDPQVRAALEPALARLAAKHPTLSADVRGYAEATGEILRWRRRSVELAAAARRASNTPFLPLVIEAGSGGGTGQGLFSAAAKDTSASSFAYPLDLVAARMNKQIVGKSTAAASLRRDPAANDSRAYSAYSPRLRATALLDPAVWASNGRQLLFELQISETQPPLTLDAAAAQYQVERGLFREVGGEVAGFRFQPLAGLFLAWRPESDFLHYGPLPPEKGAEPFRGVVVNVHLNPKWMRGEYIFAYPLR